MNVYKDVNNKFDLEQVFFHLIQLDVDSNIILKWMKSCAFGSTDFRAMSTERIYQSCEKKSL